MKATLPERFDTLRPSPTKLAYDPSNRVRRLRRALIGTTALVAVALAGTLVGMPIMLPTPAYATGGNGGSYSGGGAGGTGGTDSNNGQGGNGDVGGDGDNGGGGGGGGSGWQPAGAGGDGGGDNGGSGGAPGGTDPDLGSHGGDGGYGGYGGGGGGGGGGLHGYSGPTMPTGEVTGGTGGNGGNGLYGGGAGGGGAGGHGVVFLSGGWGETDIDLKINGGHGGHSGAFTSAAAGAAGGNGGVGLLLVGNANVTISESSEITGGTGGLSYGAATPTGAMGGSGGHGVQATSAAIIVNNGTINGGRAGFGTFQGDGDFGQGGDGVNMAPGSVLTNYGTINGGYGGGDWTGSGWGGAGVRLGEGSTLTNHGAINGDTGTLAAVEVTSGTVVNFATISAGTEKAMHFSGAGNRLEIHSGSTINGVVDALDSDNDTLAFAHDDVATFDVGDLSQQYLGFQYLELSSTATTTLTGEGFVANSVSISNGTVVVDGSLQADDITVAQGGAVTGSGTMTTALTVGADGTLAPGDSVGVITVEGDASFAASSSFAVEVDADKDSSDLLVVIGQANLDGGTVNVVGATGTFAETQDYTILTGQGGLSGTFDEASTDLTFFTPSLSYIGNSVTLTLARNNTSFAGVGVTQNHAAVAPVVEGHGFSHPLHDAVVMLSEEDARSALDQLSGEAIQASASAALIEDSDFVRDMAMARARAPFGGMDAPAMAVLAYAPGGTISLDEELTGPQNLAVWSTAFGGWGESESDGNAAALERTTAGFLVGGDVPLSPDLRLGLFAGYSHSSFEADDRASTGDSDNLHLGLYGAAQLGALGLRLGGTYAWHQVDTQRLVTVGGFSDRLTAEYDASSLQIFGEAGYRLDLNGVSVEPFAGLAHVHLETGAFAEDGGSAALSGDGGAHGLTYTTIGARIATDVQVGEMPARASGGIGWRHAFGDVTVETTQSFETGPVFTVSGTPIARDALVIEAGLNLDITDTASFGLAYDGQIGANAHDHALSGTLKVRF